MEMFALSAQEGNGNWREIPLPVTVVLATKLLNTTQLKVQLIVVKIMISDIYEIICAITEEEQILVKSKLFGWNNFFPEGKTGWHPVVDLRGGVGNAHPLVAHFSLISFSFHEILTKSTLLHCGLAPPYENPGFATGTSPKKGYVWKWIKGPRNLQLLPIPLDAVFYRSQAVLLVSFSETMDFVTVVLVTVSTTSLTEPANSVEITCF